MTTITTTEIPPESYLFRVFVGDKDPDKSDIDTVGAFLNHGQGVCEVAGVHGVLSDEVNVAIGLKAIELGFITMRFSALPDHRVTRYARLIGADAYFRYYEVDLLEVKEDLGL